METADRRKLVKLASLADRGEGLSEWRVNDLPYRDSKTASVPFIGRTVVICQYRIHSTTDFQRIEDRPFGTK